jgi:hypothetical protein
MAKFGSVPSSCGGRSEQRPYEKWRTGGALARFEDWSMADYDAKIAR